MLTDDSEFAIAHEIWAAAQLARGEGIEDGASRIAAILERIDAERGRRAVAWLDPWTGNNVTTDYDAYGDRGIPLFLSPTIQEGMALVPIEPTQKMFDAGEETFVSGYTGTPTSSPSAVWEAMLTAAQGERK